MKKSCFILLTALLLVLLCAASVCLADTQTMYIYTENGGPLKVRETPSPSGKVLDKIAYGKAVQVQQIRDDCWSAIEWESTGTAYVMSRFLINTEPPAHTGSNADDKITDKEKIVDALNGEFFSAKQVETPYTVLVRPGRASGWINMRWAPSASINRVCTYSANKELTVIAETKKWYLVQDPENGMVGYISRDQATVKR